MLSFSNNRPSHSGDTGSLRLLKFIVTHQVLLKSNMSWALKVFAIADPHSRIRRIDTLPADGEEEEAR